MYIVKYAKRGSEDYNQTLQIRGEVFFKPLGRDIAEYDLSCEDNNIVIGAFETNSIYTNLIIGTAVISQRDATTFKVEWLCADPILRKKGIGTSLMQCVEKIAADRGARKLCLDATADTVDFFQRFGYMQKGEFFTKEIFGSCIQMVKPVFSMPKREKTDSCSCGHDHHHSHGEHGHSHNHHSHEGHSHHHDDCGCGHSHR